MGLLTIEKKLDELIVNAEELNECDEDCSMLLCAQEKMLDDLLAMTQELDEGEKQRLLHQSPRLYSVLEEKIARICRINEKRLRPISFVRKARIHRRRMKNF